MDRQNYEQKLKEIELEMQRKIEIMKLEEQKRRMMFEKEWTEREYKKMYEREEQRRKELEEEMKRKQKEEYEAKILQEDPCKIM